MAVTLDMMEYPTHILAQETYVSSVTGWLSGYTTRRKLTIDNAKIDDALTDFPVLVMLTSGNFDFTKANADGFDIRFTSDNGTTLLKYERERHDAGAQKAEYWVKIPSIASGSDTEFYIYYRTQDTDDGADPTNVWDGSFSFVWHSKDDPDTSHVKDSTVNARNGTKYAANQPVETDGLIAKAQDYDGSNDYIGAPDWPWTFGYGVRRDQGKISVWAGGGWLEDTGNIINQNVYYHYTYVSVAGSAGRLYFNGNLIASTGLNLGVNITLTHLALSEAASTADRERLGDRNPIWGNVLRIGGQEVGYPNKFWNGKIDEVRRSDAVRTDAWIKADANSQLNTLLTCGGEEVNPLLAYSEDTDKTQGDYSLEVIAQLTSSLNGTLTRTISPTIDLSDLTKTKFDVKASRIGSNLKVRIRDSGSTWSEFTVAISVADEWVTKEWDISGIANKSAIDRIQFKIIEASADNILYIDNMWAGFQVWTFSESLGLLENLTKLEKGMPIFTESLALLESLPQLARSLLLEELLALNEEEKVDVSSLFTESLGLLESLPTLGRALTLEESLALLESLPTLDIGLSLQEDLALSEDLTEIARALTLTESLALLESETAAISSVLTENLALKEDLTQLGRTLTLEESLALLEELHAHTLLCEIDKDGNIKLSGLVGAGDAYTYVDSDGKVHRGAGYP